MGPYKKLILFQKADELAHKVYSLTQKFPKSELYGLTSQLRRAALSIPTNIVEGTSRKSKKELKQFINIAIGSYAETEYLINFSRELAYHSSDSKAIDLLLSDVGKLLWKFYQSL
jgi:four helix bundle protein